MTPLRNNLPIRPLLLRARFNSLTTVRDPLLASRSVMTGVDQPLHLRNLPLSTCIVLSIRLPS